MIKTLFKAVNSEQEISLDNLQSQIGLDPKIAWYPSSGLDFRDLMEVNRTTSIEPDLFFHTDYNYREVKLKCEVVYSDQLTKVTIEDITELQFIVGIDYNIQADFVTFPENASRRLRIYLLNVRIESSLELISKPVIFFYMDNINFLDEVLLKHRIHISHLIKVREGCTYGGNEKSISVAYAFLGALNLKYILVDNEAEIDKELINQISQKHDLSPLNYTLKNSKKIYKINDWSGLIVRVFELYVTPKTILAENNLHEILKQIKK